ncbi:MAG TPA: N-acetylmuramoyl-L-alanine amidase [Candidatus Acidoferrales bacterium]|jgi:N-acetylmuramoyl-L-alanine amidase|nr:N-acetylmuramoyl-L-alanine amidase [Candidatus Acidoferrales bacterium]
MKRFGFTARQSASRNSASATALLIALALFSLFLTSASRADDKQQSEKQYDRAVKMRTMLEGYLERDRSLNDYQQTVLAFRKVYLITPEAPDATQALIAEAELYESMGRLFDPKFFHEAIARYNFLLKQYPGTKYRGDALLAIGKIQKNDLKSTVDAEATFKGYLKKYPHAENAAQAQQALKDLASPGTPTPAVTAQQSVQAAPADSVKTPSAQNPAPAVRQIVSDKKQPEDAADTQPDLRGQAVEPRVSDERISNVTKVQTWNSPESTRIVITLNDTIAYESARIVSPDRIYFNLYKAKVSTRLTRKALEVDDGLLQSVRIAQNKPDVVRLVLSVSGEKDYSAFLLANPYRLVIDLHGRGTATVAKSTAQTPPAQAADIPSARTEVKPTIGSNLATVAPNHPATPTVNLDRNAPATAELSAPPDSLPTKSAKEIGRATPPARLAEKTVLPLSREAGKTTALLTPPTVPKPTRDGERSLTRALGLKISRIVIDAGHGGHDTGTIGPHGLMEKDLCLDVALRLGALIEQKLPGADVIYTRKDDTFVPLEERTNIANQAQADLFISIHANSSHDSSARGVETYYLNFATSEDAMEVASRENALSQESLHDLQGLIQKIARNDKIEESKEFASDVQDSLTQRLQLVSRSERNRGVKKAPFVVLIGANMPSILTEISFVSNPNDEKLLRKGDQRERIADGLFRGISSYLDNLNSLSNNKQKLISASPSETTAVASNGNPK